MYSTNKTLTALTCVWVKMRTRSAGDVMESDSQSVSQSREAKGTNSLTFSLSQSGRCLSSKICRINCLIMNLHKGNHMSVHNVNVTTTPTNLSPSLSCLLLTGEGRKIEIWYLTLSSTNWKAGIQVLEYWQSFYSQPPTPPRRFIINWLAVLQHS